MTFEEFLESEAMEIDYEFYICDRWFDEDKCRESIRNSLRVYTLRFLDQFLPEDVMKQLLEADDLFDALKKIVHIKPARGGEG